MEKSKSFTGMILRVLYGENGPKSENWATFKPHSFATVRRTEKLTDIGNFLDLGLQRAINSISLQCIPWPVACSEWGTCLPPSKFRVLGANDPQIPVWILRFTHDLCVVAEFGENWLLRTWLKQKLCILWCKLWSKMNLFHISVIVGLRYLPKIYSCQELNESYIRGYVQC